jgi:hypothetical protein
MKTHLETRKEKAEAQIRKNFELSKTPWKVIGRAAVIQRACGHFKRLGKAANKGSMSMPSMLKLYDVIACSYCEKCEDQFLLRQS